MVGASGSKAQALGRVPLCSSRFLPHSQHKNVKKLVCHLSWISHVRSFPSGTINIKDFLDISLEAETIMKKIMLVDDEKDQIYFIKTSFENLFGKEYSIIPAESGEKCFELLQHQEIPHLILLDIMMPKMNGWEVFDRIRANPSWKDIPIIFLTARTDEFAEHAGALIAEDYIKKPIEIKELKARIDNVLQKAKK
jgi:CheY-like chemotaxis protein